LHTRRVGNVLYTITKAMYIKCTACGMQLQSWKTSLPKEIIQLNPHYTKERNGYYNECFRFLFPEVGLIINRDQNSHPENSEGVSTTIPGKDDQGN